MERMVYIMSDDLQKKIFAKNLLKYLALSGKSQKEVADKIDVSPQTFNTWCQGIALPRMGKVQLLADYFHINKSDLLDEHSSNQSPTITDQDMRRIERARKNMPEEDWQFLMSMITRSFSEYFEDDGSDDPD